MIKVICGNCRKTGQTVRSVKNLGPCILCKHNDWRNKFGQPVGEKRDLKSTRTKKTVGKLKMTMLAFLFAGLFGISEASAVSSCRYGSLCPQQSHSSGPSSLSDNTARTVSFIALGVAVIAIIAVATSDNSPRTTGNIGYDNYLKQRGS